MMLRVGLNPYGLAYTVGLQGAGTHRANPAPMDAHAFVRFARELGARCIELHGGWIERETDEGLKRLKDAIEAASATPIVSTWLTQTAGESVQPLIRRAARLGAPVLRLHLTPVLEGGRARWGGRWRELVQHGRSTLVADAPCAESLGIVLAVENHQDFCSEELLDIAETMGPSVGITFDTGNPFSVGEDPVAFAIRAAPRIRHVHVKDYRAQFTKDGYRLVRCAIGDGAVPFGEIAAALARHHESLTASIEPGALEARHIRLLDPAWWDGYPPRQASELAAAWARLQASRLADDEPFTTPWERGESAETIAAYEVAQVRRSFELWTKNFR